MAKQYLPTFGVAYPIESINRKMALRKETAGIKYTTGNHGAKSYALPGAKYMGGMTKQVTVIDGNGGKRTIHTNYLFVRKNARTSAISPDELVLREVFTLTSRGKNHIMKDLSQYTKVVNLWQQASADVTKTINGIGANGRTFPGWVFAVQYSGVYKRLVEQEQSYQNYDENTFPSSFDA